MSRKSDALYRKLKADAPVLAALLGGIDAATLAPVLEFYAEISPEERRLADARLIATIFPDPETYGVETVEPPPDVRELYSTISKQGHRGIETVADDALMRLRRRQ